MEIVKETKIHLEFDGMLLTVYSNEEVERLRTHLKDAKRYQWLRQNPAWETEAFLGELTPEQFDVEVDKAMA
jgi:hypothetical protein